MATILGISTEDLNNKLPERITFQFNSDHQIRAASRRIRCGKQRFRVTYIYPLKSTQDKPHVQINDKDVLLNRPALPARFTPVYHTHKHDATFKSLWAQKAGVAPLSTLISYIDFQSVGMLQYTCPTLYQAVNAKLDPCTGFTRAYFMNYLKRSNKVNTSASERPHTSFIYANVNYFHFRSLRTMR